jgi:hypothetical protein
MNLLKSKFVLPSEYAAYYDGIRNEIDKEWFLAEHGKMIELGRKAQHWAAQEGERRVVAPPATPWVTKQRDAIPDWNWRERQAFERDHAAELAREAEQITAG